MAISYAVAQDWQTKNRSSTAQYYALAVYIVQKKKKKLLHYSCPATHHSTLQLHPVHWLVSFSEDASLAYSADRRVPVVKKVGSLAALKLCYSLTTDQILRILMRYFPSCQNATLPQPWGHHLTGQSNCRGTCSGAVNSWMKGEPALWDSQRSATGNWYTAEPSGPSAIPEHRQKDFTLFLNGIPQLVNSWFPTLSLPPFYTLLLI